jgi:hypothetical protein
MKCYAYEAVVYDRAIYCVDCIPDGVTVDDGEVSPIFADSEWDYYPVCEHCGTVHDYVSLTEDGWRYQQLNEILRRLEDNEFPAWDDELLVSDLAEVPEGFEGTVLHVNDHGNVELYVVSGENYRSIASRV